MLEELKPCFINQESYYKKAYTYTLENENTILLYSYNTLVCTIYNNNRYSLNTQLDEKLLYSNTTLKHIKDFIGQHIKMLGLSYAIDGVFSKKDLIKNNNKVIK